MQQDKRTLHLLEASSNSAQEMLYVESASINRLAKDLCRINEGRIIHTKDESGNPYWHNYRGLAQLAINAALSSDFSNEHVKGFYCVCD